MTDFTLSRRGLFRATAGGAAATLLAGQAVQAASHAAAAAFLPTTYDRMVGTLRVTTVMDGYFDLGQEIITNLDPALIKEGMTAAYLDPAGPMRLAVSSHIIRSGDQVTLIDGGAGMAFGPTAGRLQASLAALGILPEMVTRVVATHMHPDHIGGLMGEAGAAFPNASLHISEADLAFWTDEGIAAGAPADFQPFFALARGVRDAYAARLTPFAGDIDLGAGLSTIAMPGHTPGHTGLRVSDGADQMIIWGDCAALASLQFRHPDAGIAFDADGAMAAATRRKVLDMVVADRIAVAGTHLPFPGVGHVEARDGAFAWVPEEWRAL